MEFKCVFERAAGVMAIAALVMANVASNFELGSVTTRARNLEVFWNGIAVVLGLGDVPSSPGVLGARLLAGTAVVVWATFYVRDRRVTTGAS